MGNFQWVEFRNRKFKPLLFIFLISFISLGISIKAESEEAELEEAKLEKTKLEEAEPEEEGEENCQHTEDKFVCLSYVRAYDADSITVEIPYIHSLLGKDITIRLVNVDAPEIRGQSKCEKEKAIEARDFVRRLLEESEVIEVRNISRGKYFRIVGDLMVDGKSLSQILIQMGYGVPYDGGTKEQIREIDWCRPLRPLDQNQKEAPSFKNQADGP